MNRPVVVVALLVALGGMAVRSPLLMVAGPLVVLAAGAEHERRRRRRREAQQAEALPGAVDHIIHHLRSGGSLRQACLSLHQIRASEVSHEGPQPLAALTDVIASGGTLAQGARVLAADQDGSVRLVGVTLSVLAANGGPAVPALQRLRHTLMGRVHRRRRAEAQAAQALASAGLLVVAPVVFAALLAMAEPTLARFYLREPMGAAFGASALALSGAGWWWMQHIVNAMDRGSR